MTGGTLLSNGGTLSTSAATTITSLSNVGAVTLTNSAGGIVVTTGVAGGAVTIDGAVTINGGAVGAVTVNAGKTLTIGGAVGAGAITNNGTVDLGANTLTATSMTGGTLLSNGGTLSTSAATTIASLSNLGAVTLTNSAGGIVVTAGVAGGAVTIDGAVTINGGAVGAVTVNATKTLIVGGTVTTGVITNNGTVAVGANALTATSVNGVVTVGAAGTINAAGTITTLTVTTSATLNGTGAGLTVTGPLVGSPNLTLSNLVTLAGAIGTISSSGTLTLNGDVTSGVVTNTGTVAVGGNTLTATSINGAVTVGPAGTINAAGTITTLTVTTSATLNGTGGGLTVTSPLVGSPNLTLSNLVTLAGAIGTINNSGTLTQSGNIVSGAITNAGTIAAGGNTLSFTTIAGAGNVTTTSGVIAASGAGGTIATLTVTTGVTINGGAGITITNSVTGNLTTSGLVTLNGLTIGTINNTGTLTLNGDITSGVVTNTTGTVAVGVNTLTATSINGAVTIGAAGTISASGTITTLTVTTSATLNGTGAGLTVTTALASSPNMTLNGLVTLQGLTIGTINNAGTLTLNGSITSGALTNSGTIAVAGNTLSFTTVAGAGVVTTTNGVITASGTGGTIATLTVTTGATINGGGTGITVTNAVTGNLITSGFVTLNGTTIGTVNNSGTLALNAPTTITADLAAGTTAGLDMNGNGLTLSNAAALSGSIFNSAGPANFLASAAITLAGAASISTSNGDVTFSNSLTSPTTAYSLTVNKGSGTLSFLGSVGVGAGNALAAITTDGGGNADINGGAITTTGAQMYNGPTRLTASTVLTTTNNNVSFGAAVSSSAVGWTLTIAAGTGSISFASTLGSVGIPLGALLFTSNALTFAGAANTIHTNSTITIQPATTGTSVGIAAAGGTLQVTTSDVAALSASCTGITIGYAAGTAALSVNTVTFNSPLTLQANGGGLIVVNGTITTTAGSQTYNGPVRVGGTSTIATSGVNVIFNGTVNSPGTFGLTLTKGAGTVTFTGIVGGVNPLLSLTTDAGGTIAINTTGISTTAGQTYNGPVLLGANANLSSVAGPILFVSTVDGAQALTVNSGSGTATFNSAVGGGPTLISLTVSSTNAATNAISLVGVLTTGSQSYTGKTTLNGPTIRSTTNGGGATISFAGSVDLAADVGITTFNNAITFGQTVDGGTITLTLTAGTATAIFAGAITMPTSTMVISTGTVDVQSSDFTIGTLTNATVFKLTGQQATQTITTPNNVSGTVQYYGTGGTIGLDKFYNLTIAGPGTFTLKQPIAVGPATGGGTLLISGGTLDVDAINSYQITIAGTWTNTVGTSGFAAHSGIVLLTSTTPSQIFTINGNGIAGNTTFFVFRCIDPNASVLFQAGSTISIAAGGTFNVAGTSGNVIVLNTTSVGTHWMIDVDPAALVVMAWVTVNWSDASFNPIVIPLDVIAGAPHNDIQWLDVILVTASSSEDADNDGKIDRILVTTAAAINDDFSGFTAKVPGYTVTGYEDRTSFSAQFYIYLKDNTDLSTGAVAGWSIVSNSTLLDAATLQKRVFIQSPPYPIVDTAPPLVGYTLAVVGKRDIFIRFSEPVYHGPGFATPISVADFTYAPSAISSLTPVTTAADGVGVSEALLTVADTNGISADDVVAGTLLRVTGPLIDRAGLSIVLPGSGGHRVSDIGLGLPGSSLFEPVWARDLSIRPATSGIGYITVFDGTKWLRTGDDLTLEGNITPLTTLPLAGDTHLSYDMNVATTLETATGLWLPPITQDLTLAAGFSGLVPTIWDGTNFKNPAWTTNTDARTVAEAASNQSNLRLRDFVIPSTDSEDKEGARVDFLFSIKQGSALLYTASVPNPALDASWYRHLTTWSFALHTVQTQRGTVSILNNVINPDKGDSATLQYTLAETGAVTVTVFDLAGTIVKVLVRGTEAPGTYEQLWDGTNNGGKKVTRGIYFIRILAPGIDEIRKVLVVR